jgi:hypothetical protein
MVTNNVRPESVNAVTNQLTNRDIALLVWLAVFIIFILVKRDIRNSVKPLLRMLFLSKITLVLLVMLAYVSLVILAGYTLGAWQPWMLKDSLYWFLGTALVVFFRVNQVSNDEHFFKKVMLESFRLAVVVDFIINLYVFNLVFELLLLPLVVFLGMLLAVSDLKPEYAQVKTLLRGLVATIGVVILVHAGMAVISDPGSLATLENLEDLLLPLVLTALLLPLVYGLALLMMYETLYVQLKIFGRNQAIRRFTMWQIVKACNLRVSRIRQFSRRFLTDLRSADTKAEVVATIKQFRVAMRSRPR